jgi:hypothetical protein
MVACPAMQMHGLHGAAAVLGYVSRQATYKDSKPSFTARDLLHLQPHPPTPCTNHEDIQ